MNNLHALILVLIISGVTILVRFLPFLVFSKGAPHSVLYLGQVLPYAIMGMLVVYCLKHAFFLPEFSWLPEAISVAAVVALHKWKHNTLLSILAGTVCYMILIRLPF